MLLFTNSSFYLRDNSYVYYSVTLYHTVIIIAKTEVIKIVFITTEVEKLSFNLGYKKQNHITNKNCKKHR